VKELEHARELSDAANCAKSAFLANMSHEIRTPMNGILGLADLLQEETDVEKRRRYVRLLRDSAGGLMNVLNDILDLSKIEAGQMTIESVPFGLEDCVAAAVQMLSATALKKELMLSCDISAKLPPRVAGDPFRLRQILLNLIGNAIKFTAQGFVRVTAEPAGPCVRLRVQDSGIGISQEKQKVIFEPFQQGDVSTTRIHGGTGLGLAIVAELVKLMHGTICMASEPGAGTVVQVDIPLPVVEALAPTPSTPVCTVRPNLNVLVAEDNRINQLVTSKLLENRGHSVTVVADGQAAVAAVLRGGYDLVLMDVQMPVMDGIAATRAIREKEKGGMRRMPIVALTAHAMRGDENALLEAGMDAYVSKPVSADRLFAAIAACCGS
jgi:CheY-like chemotaxis protein